MIGLGASAIATPMMAERNRYNSIYSSAVSNSSRGVLSFCQLKFGDGEDATDNGVCESVHLVLCCCFVALAIAQTMFMCTIARIGLVRAVRFEYIVIAETQRPLGTNSHGPSAVET
jgi:hypothetical protein